MAYWWVANTGSDSNAGTSGSPLRTIYQAYNNCAAGDTIYITSGQYFWLDNAQLSGSRTYFNNPGWPSLGINKTGIIFSGIGGPIVTTSITGGPSSWTYYPAGDSAHGHPDFTGCYGIPISAYSENGVTPYAYLTKSGDWPVLPLTNTVSITGLSIYVAGSNYNLNDRLGLEGGLINGAVGNITIVSSGLTYSNTNNIAFSSGHGSLCSGNILTNAGKVTGIIITNPGKNYLANDNLGIPGGNGSGYFQVTNLGPSCQVLVTGTGAGGSITGFQILSSGTGYGLHLQFFNPTLSNTFYYAANMSSNGINAAFSPTGISNVGCSHFANPELVNSNNYFNLAFNSKSLVDSNGCLLYNISWYDAVNSIIYFKTGYTNGVASLNGDPSPYLYICYDIGFGSQQIYAYAQNGLTFQGINFNYLGWGFHIEGSPTNNFNFLYNTVKYCMGASIVGGGSGWIVDHNIFDKNHPYLTFLTSSLSQNGGYAISQYNHYFYFEWQNTPCNMYLRNNVYSRNNGGYAVQMYSEIQTNVAQYNNIYMDNQAGGLYWVSGISEHINNFAILDSNNPSGKGLQIPILQYGQSYGPHIANNYMENSALYTNGVEVALSGLNVEYNISYNTNSLFNVAAFWASGYGGETFNPNNTYINNNTYMWTPQTVAPFNLIGGSTYTTFTGWKTGVYINSNIPNFDSTSTSITGGLPTILYPGETFMDSGYSINTILSYIKNNYINNIVPVVGTATGPYLNVIGYQESYPIPLNTQTNLNILLLASGHTANLALSGYNLALANSGGTLIWDASGSPYQLTGVMTSDGILSNNLAYSLSYTAPNTGLFRYTHNLNVLTYSGSGINPGYTGILQFNIPTNFELNSNMPISWATFGQKTVMISGSGTGVVWDVLGSPRIVGANSTFTASDGLRVYTINRIN